MISFWDQRWRVRDLAAPNQLTSSEELSLWILGLVTVAISIAGLALFARIARDPIRMEERRLLAFAHPVSTVAGRIVITVLVVLLVLASTLLAMYIEPMFWTAVFSTVALYSGYAYIWFRSRGHPRTLTDSDTD